MLDFLIGNVGECTVVPWIHHVEGLPVTHCLVGGFVTDVGETSWGKGLVDLGIFKNPYKTGPVQGDGIDFQGVFSYLICLCVFNVKS